MLDPVVGSVWYVNSTKKGQKIGIKMGTKVFHFKDESDELYQVGDEFIVTAVRKEIDAATN